MTISDVHHAHQVQSRCRHVAVLELGATFLPTHVMTGHAALQCLNSIEFDRTQKWPGNLQDSCKSHARVIHTLGLQQALACLHHAEDYRVAFE
jgi:hypothetical protein